MIEITHPFNDSSIKFHSDVLPNGQRQLGAIELLGGMFFVESSIPGREGEQIVFNPKEALAIGYICMGGGRSGLSQVGTSIHYLKNAFNKLGVSSPGPAVAASFDRRLFLPHTAPHIDLAGKESDSIIRLAQALEAGTPARELATVVGRSHNSSFQRFSTEFRRIHELPGNAGIATLVRAVVNGKRAIEPNSERLRPSSQALSSA